MLKKCWTNHESIVNQWRPLDSFLPEAGGVTMKWFGCSGWCSSVFLYCHVSPPSLKATRLSLEAAIENRKPRPSHLHTAENRFDQMEEGAIAFRSEALTTGLTGCSSLVELWALLLWLEWREFWTKPCIRGQEMSETTETAGTFKVYLIFYFSGFYESHCPTTHTWCVQVNDSLWGKRAARQLWPLKSERSSSHHKLSGGLLLLSVKNGCCCG